MLTEYCLGCKNAFVMLTQELRKGAKTIAQ